MVRITVNFEKRHFWIIAPILVFLAVVGMVIAFNANPTGNSGKPTEMGHSVDEMDWTKTIAKILTNELCLGGDCKTAWPAGIQSQTCTSGQAIVAIYADGTSKCGTAPVSGNWELLESTGSTNCINHCASKGKISGADPTINAKGTSTPAICQMDYFGNKWYGYHVEYTEVQSGSTPHPWVWTCCHETNCNYNQKVLACYCINKP